MHIATLFIAKIHILTSFCKKNLVSRALPSNNSTAMLRLDMCCCVAIDGVLGGPSSSCERGT